MSRRNGFTLIELLVVIAIIAILAAILFPVFAQAREKARSITCISNLKQIGLATLMYSQDYDEQMPWTSNWNKACTSFVGFPPDYSGTPAEHALQQWEVTVLPYIKSAPLLLCPTWDKTRIAQFIPANCPGSNPTANDVLSSYYWVHWTYPGYQTSELLVAGPNGPNTIAGNVIVAGISQAAAIAPAIAPIFWDWADYNFPPRQFPPHPNAVNVTYLDGHAKAFTPTLNGQEYYRMHTNDGWARDFIGDSANP